MKVNLCNLGSGARVSKDGEQMIVTSAMNLVSLADGTEYSSGNYIFDVDKISYMIRYIETTDEWYGNFGNYGNLCEVTFRACSWGYRILVRGTDDYMLCKDFASYDNAIKEYFELIELDNITKDVLFNRGYEEF